MSFCKGSRLCRSLFLPMPLVVYLAEDMLLAKERFAIEKSEQLIRARCQGMLDRCVPLFPTLCFFSFTTHPSRTHIVCLWLNSKYDDYNGDGVAAKFCCAVFNGVNGICDLMRGLSFRKQRTRPTKVRLVLGWSAQVREGKNRRRRRKGRKRKEAGRIKARCKRG